MLKSSLLLWATTLIGIVAGLAQAKVSATYLGVAGVAIFGQCLALMALVQLLVGNAILPAAVRFVARARAQRDEQQVRRVVILMRLLVLGVAVAAMLLLLLLAAEPVAYVIFSSAEYTLLVRLLALSLPLTTFALTQRTLLQAFERTDLWALDTLIWTLGGLLLLWLGVVLFGLTGAVLHLVVLGLVGSIIATLLYRRVRGQATEPLFAWGWDWSLLRQIMAYNGAAVGVSLAYTLALLGVRSLVIHVEGIAAGGIYHVVVQLSLQAIGVSVLALLPYWSPVIARLEQPADLQAAINTYTRLSLFALVPILVGIIILREPFIRLVYAAAFLPASPLLPIHALGDFWRAVYYPMFITILLQGRLLPYIVIGILRELLLVVVSYTLMLHSGLQGVVLAYLLINAASAGVAYAYTAHAFAMRYSSANRRLLGASVGTLLLALGTSENTPLWGAVPLAGVLLGLWGWISSTRSERGTVYQMLVRLTDRSRLANQPDS